MSKHQRIARYFTSGCNRWALVDNLGLVNLGHAVPFNERCPIRANAAPVIEMCAAGIKADQPMVITPDGKVRKLSEFNSNFLKGINTIEYKVIVQRYHLVVWFEDGYQVQIDIGAHSYITPIFIYHLYLELLSSPVDLTLRFPIIRGVTKTLDNWKTCHKDYFGWVSPDDQTPNSSLLNDRPIVMKQKHAANNLHMFKLITPPSLSVVPNQPNTSRIPAMEGSAAVWDADTMVRHILNVPCPLMAPAAEEFDIRGLSAASEQPDPADMILVRHAIEQYLTEKTPGQQMEEYLWMFVAKSKHSEFLKSVWDYSFENKVSIVDAFKSIMGVHEPKWKPRFMITLNSLTETTIRSDQGSLTIHHQTRDKFNQILKELYKLDELILIGENQIGATVNLKVSEHSKLTMENSSFIGSSIALKGENVFRNTMVEYGQYTDVRINAKII